MLDSQERLSFLFEMEIDLSSVHMSWATFQRTDKEADSPRKLYFPFLPFYIMSLPCRCMSPEYFHAEIAIYKSIDLFHQRRYKTKKIEEKREGKKRMKQSAYLSNLNAPDKVGISSTVQAMKSRENCTHIVCRGKMNGDSEEQHEEDERSKHRQPRTSVCILRTEDSRSLRV